MASLFLFGLLAVGLFPVCAILLLFVYKLYNDFQKKRFKKKGCVVLTRQKIGDILEQMTPSQSLRIFKSAVCDNSQIEGKKYYTKFPFGLKFISAHDNHRKAFIAHRIGRMLKNGMIPDDDMDLCADILLYLTDYNREFYYTQLISWNSLSILARLKKMVLIEHIGPDYFKSCISNDFLKGIGIVKFIFNITDYKNLDGSMGGFVNDIIVHIIENGSYPILSLLFFKLSKDPYLEPSQKRKLMNRMPDDSKLSNFMKYLDVLYFGFTQEELSEGLKNLGFQSPPYSMNTTEGEIVQFLVKDSLEEIYIPTSYMLHTFNWEDPRQQLMDFLWI